MQEFFKRKVYETRHEKVIDFIIGAAIWLVLNAIFVGIVVALANIPANDASASTLIQTARTAAVILPLVVNIALMVYFGFTRSWILLGMFGMIGAVLLLASCVSAMLIWYGISTISG